METSSDNSQFLSALKMSRYQSVIVGISTTEIQRYLIWGNQSLIKYQFLLLLYNLDTMAKKTTNGMKGDFNMNSFTT